MVTAARSKKPTGPFEAYEKNPILTNKETDEYFQAVGHSDLMYRPGGHLWGIALTKRSGPESKTFPIGREAVIFPVSWGYEWPVMDPVRGRMTGWPLPLPSRDVPGIGPFLTDGDDIDFPVGSDIPSHFVYWRFPKRENYIVSPWGRPNTLNLRASKRNLAGFPDVDYTDPVTFIGRRQTATLFKFAVVLTFDPEDHEDGESESPSSSTNNSMPGLGSFFYLASPAYASELKLPMPTSNPLSTPLPKGKVGGLMPMANFSRFAFRSKPRTGRTMSSQPRRLLTPEIPKFSAPSRER